MELAPGASTLKQVRNETNDHARPRRCEQQRSRASTHVTGQTKNKEEKNTNNSQKESFIHIKYTLKKPSGT